jgi:hypothetical protein
VDVSVDVQEERQHNRIKLAMLAKLVLDIFGLILN